MNIMCKDAQFAGRRMDFTFDVKADDVTPEGRFKGYASVWNIVDQGGDAVQPGAFTEGLVAAKGEGRLIPMLWQHDRSEPIGTWPDLAEDTKGLYAEGELVLEDNPLAKRTLSLLKKKALGGLSIGYRIPAGGAEVDAKRPGVVLLKKIGLIEISVVTMPMLIQARVQSVKSLIEGGAHPTQGDLVGVLREVGFDAELAKAIGEAAAPLLEAKGLPEMSIANDVDAFYKSLRAGISGL